MQRGEQKELAAGESRGLFRTETFSSRIGNPPDLFAHILAVRQAVSEIGLLLLLWTLLLCVLCAAACGGGSSGGGVQSPPPPPPPSVIVQVTPSSASVLLGDTVGFTASVTGTSDAGINWAVNGVPGGSIAVGAINAAGTYTAPGVLPSPASAQVTATSQADAQSSAQASVTVMSDVRVQISPPSAAVALGATQVFAATILSAGHPSSAVSWSLTGQGCAGAACGVIAADGTFTAPAVLPAQPTVTVVATSVADPSKSASATVQLSGAHVLSIAPGGATVALEQTQPFTASLDGAPTSAITWSVNGITGGNTAVGTISNSPSQKGLYLAPVDMPASRSVTISAASTAYPAAASSITLQLTSNIAVSISPAAATRIPGARQTFTATVTNTSNPQLGWTVNGLPNGNATVGQICAADSNPCAAPPAEAQPGSVDYLAPASVPSPPQVTVAAVSFADPAQSATATVTIAPQISVSISPPSLTIPPQQNVPITAAVLGIADQNVTWDVDGSANGSIARGLICIPASSPCQAPNGPAAGPMEYRAPSVPPNPSVVSVRATSETSSTAQGVALFTISTAPYITGLVPASVFAGAAAPFGLRVTGVQFAASQPGPGAAILINGVARATSCPSASECDATLAPTDVATTGTITVSVTNPGITPVTSNVASLVVVAPRQTQSIIPLDSSAPVASAMDIVVVEPTLAGSDPPEQLSLIEIGLVDPVSGVCAIGAPPAVLSRPASGSLVVRLCALGTALDQAAQIAFSSPSSPDLLAANLNTSLGSLLIEFDVTLPATAQPGPRTLFLSTANQDQAALTAAVEVQ